MKRLIFLICFTILFSCKDKTKFTIEGTFTNRGVENRIYLYTLEKDKMELIDSTLMSEKGEFKFSHSAPEVSFFRITIGRNEYMLVAKNGDEINFTSDLKTENTDYEIEGSKDADKMSAFNALRNKHIKNMDRIRAAFDEQVATHPEKREELVKEMAPSYTREVETLNKEMIRFALANPQSLVSFYAISLANPEGSEPDFIKYAELLDPELKKHKAVEAFVARINKIKTVSVGMPAPDFIINGIDDQPVKLSDFRGKYVLIDFWASWCPPCRAENPNVVKAFERYKSRNFTILGISLDKDKVAWKQAVKQDRLNWAQAGELADFEGKTVRLYQVDAIPSSFLIDPSGKIIARNLRGEELDGFLNKTLPKS